MKIKLSFISLLCLVLAFGFVACEGDEGPAGEIGEVGPQGPNGPEGPEGTGFQNCISCHQSQKIAAKVFQWEHSVHATGGNYEKNRASCAGCHTSQGFLDRVATGAATASMDIEDPLPQNCYTCHQIHNTFTEDDWAFTQSDPVTLWEGGQTLDFGKGNLCISCHQARVASPSLPDPATGGTITITNSRYGPHHGPQGTMLPGLNGYEVAGPESYENSAHTSLLANNTKHACIVCHMGTAQGTESGGHTFRVISEEGDINTAACVECHDDDDALIVMVDDRQAQIETMMEELRLKLVDNGLLDPNNDRAIVPQDFEEHEAGALYNYKFVQEDKSRGVHNFKYARALLINSIAALP